MMMGQPFPSIGKPPPFFDAFGYYPGMGHAFPPIQPYPGGGMGGMNPLNGIGIHGPPVSSSNVTDLDSEFISNVFYPGNSSNNTGDTQHQNSHSSSTNHQSNYFHFEDGVLPSVTRENLLDPYSM
jgi:hypothetical protein